MTSVMPIQIKGLVTLCVRVVASVQYADFRPRNPCRSITVTAPSPIIKPAKSINKDIVCILLVNEINCKLQYCRKRNPKEVWNLDIGNPSHMWENRNHHPDNSAKDEQDIDRCESIIFQTKHQWCVNNIKN